MEMENVFSTLLERLGYRVLRKRCPRSGLDIIARYDGLPIPNPHFTCKLQPPKFSPSGTAAFSLKRGDFTNGDIEELNEKVRNSQISDDELLKTINGSVIVTNVSKAEERIDELIQSKSVYCWDIRRLLFYSTKVRSCFNLLKDGPLIEYSLNGAIKGTYLQKTGSSNEGMMSIFLDVLVDDHDKNLITGYEETTYILNTIYNKSIKNIIESTKLGIKIQLKFHVLGLANKNAMLSSYLDYVGKVEDHPGLQLPTTFEVYQFGAAPWGSIYEEILF